MAAKINPSNFFGQSGTDSAASKLASDAFSLAEQLKIQVNDLIKNFTLHLWIKTNIISVISIY